MSARGSLGRTADSHSMPRCASPRTIARDWADMRIIAFVTEAAPVERILLALAQPTEAPPIAPARPGAALSCFAWVPVQTILVWAFAASAQLTHPPGTMISDRGRTGTSSPNRTQTWSLTSAPPGNRHLLPQRVPPPLISRPPAAPAISSQTPAKARSDTYEMSAALSVEP
jgi:hypothetical protein